MATDRLDQDLEDRLRRLNEIGAALSLERDLHTLLDRILLEARRFTGADAGTLYLVSGDELTFEITQNDTLREFTPGRSLPLDRSSASGYAATTGEILNIEDVYRAQAPYDFEGPKTFDRQAGYRTTSMLVMPMKDHEDQVIGVLQLLNAKDESGRVRAFPVADEPLARSLASQAAVSINNVRLIQDTERLFESFLQVMATAIDERSPYTGGHIRRVALMAMHVAEAVNRCTEGPLAEVRFDDDQLNELRIAAWMHDIGKITTPEWVVDKPTKLTTLYDRIGLLRTRFQWFRSELEASFQRRRADRLASGQPESEELSVAHAARLRELEEDLAFLERANLPGESMTGEDQERLRAIAAKRYLDDDGAPPPLSPEELQNLSIYRGSLTDEERQKINDHAAMSIRMLEQIPFTRKLSHVPSIAGAHHEKLDGSGYPRGLKAQQISLQARILALVDIFESISADDRPYRARALPRDVVLRILQEEVDKGCLDREVFDLFLNQRLYLHLDEIKRSEGRC